MSLTNEEHGPEGGKPSPMPIEGDGSFSAVYLAKALSRILRQSGTCHFSEVIIDEVKVQIRHSSVDANTPFQEYNFIRPRK